MFLRSFNFNGLVRLALRLRSVTADGRAVEDEERYEENRQMSRDSALLVRSVALRSSNSPLWMGPGRHSIESEMRLKVLLKL